MQHLKAEKRKELKKQVKDLLKEELIPAVLYGPDIETISIKVSEKDFSKIFKETGESELFKLLLDKDEFLVLVKDIQKDILSGRIIHIDFYQPKLGQKMELAVPLEFIGEAPAQKKGGIIVKVMHELEVECLPRQIPKEIKVDLSVLENIDSVIKIKDLNLPEGVKPLVSEENIVVSVSEPEKEEQLSQEENQPEAENQDQEKQKKSQQEK